MKQWLVYLYPRAWRARYGDEFRAVLAQYTLTIADVVDIVRGALDAHWTAMVAALRNVMNVQRLFPRTPGGCLMRGTLVVLLALCCTALSVRYQRVDAPPCQSLGAGFPVPFVCDSSGGSPIRSWGKIDGADIEGIVLLPFLTNVLFYALGVLTAWTIGYGITAVLQRQHRPWRVVVPVALGAVVVFTTTTLIRGGAGAPPWWAPIPPLPLPPGARQGDTEYLYSYDDGFHQRTTEFMIEQPVPVILAFYRVALPQRGWTYQCAVGPRDPPCGRGGWTDDTELMDVYDRGTIGTADWQTLEVRLLLPHADGTRQVRLTEVGVGGPTFTGATPVAALVGQWRATDGTADLPFLVRVLPDGQAALVLPRAMYGGTYQARDDTALRFTFTARTARVVGEPDDGPDGLCTNVPAFLQRDCHTALVLPVVYPGPNDTRRPMPSTPVRIGPAATPDPASLPTLEPQEAVGGDPAYPGPPSPPTPTPREEVDSQIDATFAVVLTATH